MTAQQDDEAMTPRLHAQGLRVRLGPRDVLQGVSLDVGPGWTALVGPNGAGKSTLLRALAGLQPLAAGRVTLDAPAGADLHALPAAQRARRLAWLAQQGEVSGELTVRETVELGRIAQLGLLGTPGASDHAAVEQAMALTECAPWQHRRLHELSGGERQRVAIARALVTQPACVLADEPTGNLDRSTADTVFALMLDLAHRHGTAFVMVTHDQELAKRCDRVLQLVAGRLAG